MLAMDHVIVLYKSKPGSCSHCVDVSNIWDNPPSKDSLSISGTLKKINPKIRFVTVTANDNRGHFNENLVPKDLIRYGVRFPQVILIPGKLWDEAMNNLGSNIKLVEGVKVFNYKIVNDVLQYDGQYSLKIPSDYGKWYQSCIDEEINDTVVSNKQLLVPIKNKGNNIFIESPVKASETKDRKEYTISKFTDVCSVQLVSKSKK